jgi:hypothetical protein
MDPAVWVRVGGGVSSTPSARFVWKHPNLPLAHPSVKRYLFLSENIRALRGLYGFDHQSSDKGRPEPYSAGNRTISQAAAKVSTVTIRRMEKTEGTLPGRYETVQKLQQAFEKAGVEFINSDKPGVRLDMSKAQTATNTAA